MIKRNQKFGLLAMLMVVMLLFSSATCYAAGNGNGHGNGNGKGHGDGTGGGGGQDKPLVVTSCSVDGAADVAVDEIIKLEFSKNVADVTVLEDNAACISVVDSEGNPATYTVTANEEFDERQILYVNCQLENDTTYTVNVSKKIIAKNMKNKLDKDYSFTFTTEKGSNNTTVAVIIIVILAGACIGYVYNRKKKNTK